MKNKVIALLLLLLITLSCTQIKSDTESRECVNREYKDSMRLIQNEKMRLRMEHRDSMKMNPDYRKRYRDSLQMNKSNKNSDIIETIIIFKLLGII